MSSNSDRPPVEKATSASLFARRDTLDMTEDTEWIGRQLISVLEVAA